MPITKKQIGMLQTRRHRAGISDDLWAEMKVSVGAASTRDLSHSQMEELLARIDSIGQAGTDFGESRIIFKIRQVLEENGLPEAYAEGIARRMFGTSTRLDWLEPERARKVLQALMVQRRRIGGEVVSAEDRRDCWSCGLFKRGRTPHALGSCTGDPWDGSGSQWGRKRHRCGGWVARSGPEDAAGRNGGETTEARDYLALLEGEKCEVCGGGKRRRDSFCRPCYMALPQHLRRNLYLLMGSGYEAAYDAALEWLESREGESDARGCKSH